MRRHTDFHKTLNKKFPYYFSLFIHFKPILKVNQLLDESQGILKNYR